MPKRHDAGTSRGGSNVGTRNTIVECGQVLEEDRWIAWLHVNREEEEQEEEEEEEEKKKEKEKEEKGEEEEKEEEKTKNDKVYRRERIADSRIERPPREFLSHDRG